MRDSMTDRGRYKNDRQAVRERLAQRDEAVSLYIANLRAAYPNDAVDIKEVRKVVDASMRGASLTELLYKQRREDNVM